MSRNRREHGRIISVETHTRGDALAEDAAAGATSITVEDAGDFDEDGGWLLIGGQVVEFSECDDDTGIITLADPLDAAAEQGDPVAVWSDLYGEVVDYQQALVELDGEYDNPDPVVAEVAEGVGDLIEGDRGKAGESCTLLRVADDEWEIVAASGRPKSVRDGSYGNFAHQRFTLTEAGAQALTLTSTPREFSEHLYVNGIEYDEEDGWSRDGAVILLGSDLDPRVGDVVKVEWARRGAITMPSVTDDSPPPVDTSPYGEPGPVTADRVETNAASNTIRWDVTAPIAGMVGDWTMQVLWRFDTDAADRIRTMGTSGAAVWTEASNGSPLSSITVTWYNDASHPVLIGVQFVSMTRWEFGFSTDGMSRLPQDGTPGYRGTTHEDLGIYYFGAKIASTPSDTYDEPHGTVTEV